MNKEQINSLVVDYQNGNDLAIGALFEIINPLIERTSNEVEKVVVDVTKFDCRVISKVKKLADTFQYDKHNFVGAVKAIISKEKSDFIKRRASHLNEMSMEFLAEPRNGEPGYQFEDTKHNVENDLLFKEKIALLAQGDVIKTCILNEWTKGAEDTSISLMLTHKFGGNSESHRKYIQRFRIKCRKRLSI